MLKENIIFTRKKRHFCQIRPKKDEGLYFRVLNDHFNQITKKFKIKKSYYFTYFSLFIFFMINQI